MMNVVIDLLFFILVCYLAVDMYFSTETWNGSIANLKCKVNLHHAIKHNIVFMNLSYF